MQRSAKRAAAAAVARYVLAFGNLIAFLGCSRHDTASTAAAPPATKAIAHAAVKLLDLNGQPVELRQVSQGRVHVVVFIQSDCPISNRIAPEVRELSTRYEPQGVDFHLIYVDPREKPEAIRAHLREYEYTCPALRDVDHTLAARTQATVTPEAVVFDRDWTITYRGRINDQFEDFDKMRNAPTKHDLRDAIAATLAGTPIAEPVTKAVGCYISDLK
jgi:cytochrome oxidase Cu insertion factor (SCO1/SenC/PrrC family)